MPRPPVRRWIGGSNGSRPFWPSRLCTATATCHRAIGTILHWPLGSSTAAASGSRGFSLRIESNGLTASVSPGPCGNADLSLGIGMPWWPNWKRSAATTGTAMSRTHGRAIANWPHGCMGFAATSGRVGSMRTACGSWTPWAWFGNHSRRGGRRCSRPWSSIASATVTATCRTAGRRIHRSPSG